MDNGWCTLIIVKESMPYGLGDICKRIILSMLTYLDYITISLWKSLEVQHIFFFSLESYSWYNFF